MPTSVKIRLVTLMAASSLVAMKAFPGGSPVTDVVTVSNYLAHTHSERQGTSQTNVRVLTAIEAVATVDAVFAKAPSSRFSADCLARMKRLLGENLAFVYSYDVTVVDEPLEYCFNGRDEKLPVGSTFSALAYCERLFDGYTDSYICTSSRKTTVHPRYCSGCVAWVSKSGGDVFCLDSVGDVEIGNLPFPVRRLETSVATGAGEQCEVELIADVEDVSFNSLEEFNHTHVAGDSHGYAPATPVATYRVELIVRQIEKGALGDDRIAFVVDPRKHEGRLHEYGSDWPFFRGMTLRVRLCREGDALKIARVQLVLPYPPYSEDVCMQSEDVFSRFALNPQAVSRPKDAVAIEYVKYGDHTLAKFYSTTNGITGSFGNFPDYSRTARVEVWTASEGANADYWRTAWFVERQFVDWEPGASPIVTVRNVEEGMDAETRLAFAWHGFGLPSCELAAVKTLGAFVDLVNRRTVCTVCKKPHYRVVLPDDLRPRAISFEEDAYSYCRALDLLKSVCERTGCTYSHKGEDIVLASELSKAELSDLSLEGRLHILEKDGFASVVGAGYVRFAYWGGDYLGFACRGGGGLGQEKPHDAPLAFSFRSEYVTTGNGWRRKTADGKDQYLMFDAVWWDADDGKGRDGEFHLSEAKPRLARDVAKVRAYLRDAAESPDDFSFRYQAEERDAFALGFAFHLYQLGRTEDAQSIYDALLLRPSAAVAAFAKLRQRVKLGRRQYPTLESWKKFAGKEKER